MRLKPRNGSAEETTEIGGIESEELNGYHVCGTDGTPVGYFGADRYENHFRNLVAKTVLKIFYIHSRAPLPDSGHAAFSAACCT